jgi:hypothetical protein
MSTAENLRVLQQKMKVPEKLCFIDAQYDTGLTYTDCVRFNWTALHGSGRDGFTHIQSGKQVQKFFSPVKEAAAPTGGRARYIFWSNEGVKDRLSQLRAQGSPVWEYPKDVPAEYLKQINSEVKKEVVDKVTKRITHRYVRLRKDNHMWDTEAMTTAAALMLGLLKDH